MKKIFRRLFFNLSGIAILAYWIEAISYQDSLRVLLAAGVVFSLIDMVIKPIVKAVLLPINLVTLGLFGWLVEVLVLYSTEALVAGFEIGAYNLGPATVWLFRLPKIVLSEFWGVVVAAIGLKLIKKIMSKLI